MSNAFTIHCPACSAGYLLSRSLMGPLGARVTCPACREAFGVGAGGELVQGTAAAAASRETARTSGAATDERALAREILDDLAARVGDDLAMAARESRLFRDHGRELLEAFDHFRERAGRQVGAGAFLDELMLRWRVDLSAFAGSRG